jgi:hypothetical protein
MNLNPLSLHFSTSIWPKPSGEVHWGIGANVVWRAKERVPLCTLGFDGKFETIVEPLGLVWGEDGMEWNKKNNFGIFFLSLVWEFKWRKWKVHSLV